MSSERLGVRSADKQVAHCEGGSVRVVLSQPCAWRWEAISPDLFRFMLREPQHDGIFPSSIFHTRHCPRFFTANRHCYCHCNCQLHCHCYCHCHCHCHCHFFPCPPTPLLSPCGRSSSRGLCRCPPAPSSRSPARGRPARTDCTRCTRPHPLRAQTGRCRWGRD